MRYRVLDFIARHSDYRVWALVPARAKDYWVRELLRREFGIEDR